MLILGKFYHIQNKTLAAFTTAVFRFRRSLILLLLITISLLVLSAKPGRGQDSTARPRAVRLCELKNKYIRESSGLAYSRHGGDVLWTHNDSGNKPFLYALGMDCLEMGVFPVQGAENTDWEDMASFKMGDTSYLLIADVGSANRSGKPFRLYLIREPKLAVSSPNIAPLKVEKTVEFRIDGKRHDFEAAAVDPTTMDVYLISKEWGLVCKVYKVPLFGDRLQTPVRPQLVSNLFLSLVTGMDISSDGRRAVVVTYGDAYEYTRKPDETWAKAFSRFPAVIPLPPRNQGESVCYGPDNVTLFLTSEKLPTPLWKIER